MIGALRNKLEILVSARVSDEAGGAQIVWAPGPEIWAEIDRLSSTRDVLGDASRRLKRISARVRFRLDLAHGHRVRFENDQYEIVPIEEGEGRNRRLTLICEETAS